MRFSAHLFRGRRGAAFRASFLSFLFIVLLTFTACKNLFEDSFSEQGQPGQNVESEITKRVSYRGTVSVSNSLPSEINKMLSTTAEVSRSAYAGLPTSDDFEYYVCASSSADTQEVVPTLTDQGRVFELELLIDTEYTLTAGYRKKASGTQGQSGYVPAKDCLKDIASVSGDSYSLTITEENLSQLTPYRFVLVPLQTSGGKGAINLAIAEIADSNINSLKLFVAGEDGKPVAWQTDALDIDIEGSTLDGKFIRSKKDANGNLLYNIPSGCYEVSLNFYKTDTNVSPAITYIAYQTIQTINVYDNLVTDIWQNENAASTNSVITGGEFKLTATLVNNFLNHLLYVGVPENLAGNSSVIPASDSNTGRAYSPLKTLGRALSLIGQDGNGSDYRIYITGDMTDNYAGDYMLDASYNSKASSIEIKGIGSSRSVLKGTGTNNVFTISTTSPIIFENVQITGGKSDQGAGLYIYKVSNTTTGPSVTLGLGALVGKEGNKTLNQNNCGNLGETEGAGIFISEGTLTLKNGSKVCRNYVYDGNGAGIFCEGSTLIMETGAEVSGNKSEKNAGGIYINNGSFTMKGGLISNNIAVGENAGGLYIASTSSFIMKGGTISNNQSSVKGGGITVKKGGSLKLSGSAAIPFGVTENSTTTRAAGKNDIYLERTTEGSAVIELAGAVASDFSEVGITTGGADSVSDGDWVLGQQVVNGAAGTSITESFAEKINCLFPDTEWDKVVSSSVISVSCPFFVGSYTKQDGDLITGSDENGTGTKASPYATIEKACQQMNDKDIDYVIKIIGTTAVKENGQYNLALTKTQYIPNSLSTAAAASHKAKSVLITGARGVDEDGMPQDSIDRGIANSLGYYGSAFSIETSVPVTITNLLITGAQANDAQTGLSVKADAKVTLGDGVVITGNASDAMAISNGGKVAICGSCIIGNKTANSKPEDAYNSAQTNKYGIKCDGELYLGARMNADGTHTEEAWTGAIMGNNGCGLHIDGFANDSNPKDNPIKCIMYSGSIKYNYSASDGGGINISGSGANAELTIKGGEITDNNVVFSKVGSGIYIGSGNKVTFDGQISIVNNDVYLSNSNIIVTDSFSLKNSDKKIPIKFAYEYTMRNTDILTGSVNDTNVGYIDFSATGFKLAHVQQDTNHYGRIVFKHILKDLYVASTSDSDPYIKGGVKGVDLAGDSRSDSYWQHYQYDSNNSDAIYSFNEETSGSNAAHPFASIQKALQFITYQQSVKDENGNDFNYTIYIDGRVEGSHSLADSATDYITLKKPGTNVTDATANKIILKSRNTASSDEEPQDILYARNSNSSCLTINTSVPIEITNLMIEGAYLSEGSGGGIYIRLQDASPSSDVTINGLTQIKQNIAKFGGGIYCEGKDKNNRALLKICGNAKIFNNVAYSRGGGLYITYGDLCLYENAVIGEANKGSHAREGNQGSDYSNEATISGGGIYAESSGLYFGYKAVNTVDENECTGGVMYNYVSSTDSGEGLGAGIYCTGDSVNPSVVKIASGNISYNGTDISDTSHYSKGGGIYFEATGSSFEMIKGRLEYNASSTGGGIYATQSTSEDTIIIKKDVSIANNYAVVNGGAIYSERHVNLSATMNNNQVASGKIGGGIFMGGYGNNLTLDSDFNITTTGYAPARGKDDIATTFTPEEGEINEIYVDGSLSHFSADNQIGLTIDNDTQIFAKLADYGPCDSIINDEAPKFKLLASGSLPKYKFAYTNENRKAELDVVESRITYSDLNRQRIKRLFVDSGKAAVDQTHEVGTIAQTGATNSSHLNNSPYRIIILAWADYVGAIYFSNFSSVPAIQITYKLYQEEDDTPVTEATGAQTRIYSGKYNYINILQDESWGFNSTTEPDAYKLESAYQIRIDGGNFSATVWADGNGSLEAGEVKWYLIPNN